MAAEWPDVRRLIKDRPEAFWGFKAPSIFGHLQGRMDEFRAPRLIYVIRDPVDNAESIQRHLVAPESIENAAENIADEISRALILIPTWGVPHLFVSYSQMILRTEQSVRRLAEFLGVDVRREALNEVRMDDPRYLKAPS